MDRPPIHLCIGAPRSGTGWLFNNLAAQPSIFTPIVKEVRYWNGRHSDAAKTRSTSSARRKLKKDQEREIQAAWLRRWKKITRASTPSMAEYLRLMSVPDRPSIDISPVYSLLPRKKVKALYEGLPRNSRVLYFIRNPLDRLLSQMKLHLYLRGKFRGAAHAETLKTLMHHEKQLQRCDFEAIISLWQSIFGDRFMFLNYQDLADNPVQFIHRVADFFDIPLDEKIVQERAAVYVGTDRYQLVPSIIPKQGFAERKLAAEALRPLIERFSVSYPTPGTKWLEEIERAMTYNGPDRHAVDDVSAAVHKLMRMTESLGDNGEYGYWQSHRGYEPTSLFRWATTPIDGLLAYLKESRPVFAFDQLSAHAPQMVHDATFGFTFPSKLVLTKEDGTLYIPELSEVADVYAAEAKELAYLEYKFARQLAKYPALYVIKDTRGFNKDRANKLHSLLCRRNADHKLLWVEKGKETSLEVIAPGLYRGQIPWFADVMQPASYHPTGWTQLMTLLCERQEIMTMMERMIL